MAGSRRDLSKAATFCFVSFVSEKHGDESKTTLSVTASARREDRVEIFPKPTFFIVCVPNFGETRDLSEATIFLARSRQRRYRQDLSKAATSGCACPKFWSNLGSPQSHSFLWQDLAIEDIVEIFQRHHVSSCVLTFGETQHLAKAAIFDGKIS